MHLSGSAVRCPARASQSFTAEVPALDAPLTINSCDEHWWALASMIVEFGGNCYGFHAPPRVFETADRG